MTEELLTYRDAYEALRDTMNLAGKDENTQIRNLRRAVIEAYRKLPGLHAWRYFVRTTQITTDAIYNTGTITYTYSTNQLVLSGGTWPANAVFGTVEIDENRYKVSRRVDNTTLELDTNVRPPADVAAGTSYAWRRFRYLLPIDVGDVRSVVDADQSYLINRVDLNEVFWKSNASSSTSAPFEYTIIRSEDYPGRWEIWLSSVDTEVHELHILYDARMITLPIEEISTGTVSTTGDVATFSSGVLTADCVGCVLRIGTGSDKPTPRVGSWIDTDTGHVTRFPEAERVILQFTNSTTAVLNRALDSDVSTRAYSLSSHIDFNPTGMWELFARLAELQYDIITRADGKKVMESRSAMQEAFREARISDARAIEMLGRGYVLAEPTVLEGTVS